MLYQFQVHNIGNRQFSTLRSAHHEKSVLRGKCSFYLIGCFLTTCFSQRPRLPLLQLKSGDQFAHLSFFVELLKPTPPENLLALLSYPNYPFLSLQLSGKRNDMNMNKMTYQPSKELLAKAEKEFSLLMASVPNHVATSHMSVCSYELFRRAKPTECHIFCYLRSRICTRQNTDTRQHSNWIFKKSLKKNPLQQVFSFCLQFLVDAKGKCSKRYIVRLKTTSL